MHTQKAVGFTVIEVVIFLAITGLMILIALTGTGTRLSTTRFTDSMRSLESFMQRQYDETINGVNTRTAADSCPTEGSSSIPGQSQQCLLLGKYLYFSPSSNTIRAHYIIGTQTGQYQSSDSDGVAIFKSKPYVVQGSNVETYNIQWGAEIVGTKQDDGTVGGKKIDSVAFVRSPKSSAVYTYTFDSGGGAVTDISSFVDPAKLNSRQSNICIKSKDTFPTRGALTVSRNGRGQDTVSVRIDISDADMASLCSGA